MTGSPAVTDKWLRFKLFYITFFPCYITALFWVFQIKEDMDRLFEQWNNRKLQCSRRKLNYKIIYNWDEVRHGRNLKKK